jgi:hypothetical protein
MKPRTQRQFKFHRDRLIDRILNGELNERIHRQYECKIRSNDHVSHDCRFDRRVIDNGRQDQMES